MGLIRCRKKEARFARLCLRIGKFSIKADDVTKIIYPDPVRVHSSLGGKKLNVNRLIKEYRIDLPETIRYYDADTDEDGLLVLDLRTARVSPKAANHWKKNLKIQRLE